VLDALRDLARLLVPVECPGCGEADVLLCDPCAGWTHGGLTRREADAPRLERTDDAVTLPVWALASYVGPLRGTIVAWKDKGRHDLSATLERAVHHAGRTLAPWVRDVVGPGATVLVVPAPSSGAARRARGREPVRGLASAVAAGLAEAGTDARVVPVLGQHGRDQVGRGARRRGTRLGEVRATRRAARASLARPGTVCLLVDDVLTTGATLAACRTVLETMGARVVCALVLAATPSPRRGPATREVHLPKMLPLPPGRVNLGTSRHGERLVGDPCGHRAIDPGLGPRAGR
jgi:predicted amidophosphoribosyltransferase